MASKGQWWIFELCDTSTTSKASKAKWWNFELLAESLFWYPKYDHCCICYTISTQQNTQSFCLPRHHLNTVHLTRWIKKLNCSTTAGSTALLSLAIRSCNPINPQLKYKLQNCYESRVFCEHPWFTGCDENRCLEMISWWCWLWPGGLRSHMGLWSVSTLVPPDTDHCDTGLLHMMKCGWTLDNNTITTIDQHLTSHWPHLRLD